MNLSKILRNKISTPVAIGTIILVVVLAGGILVWHREFPLVEFLPKLKEQVTLTTDKTEYEQGEVVKVILKNGLNKPIWYNKHINCGEPFWWVEQSKDGEWKRVFVSSAQCLYNMPQPEATELSAGEEINAEWDLKVYDSRLGKREFTQEGLYRIGTGYGFEKEGEGNFACVKNGKTIYSNEFRIKEKSEGEKSCRQDNDCVLVSTNCCPCSAGGSKTCINENYLDEWRQKIDCQVGGDCPEEYRCGIEPTICRCINNICQGFRE